MIYEHVIGQAVDKRGGFRQVPTEKKTREGVVQ